MTVYKLGRVLARQAAEAAVSLARGEAVRDSTSVPKGNCNVPEFLVTPAVVTKKNVMEKVIKDGFQNLDTIQKSQPAEKWPK